MIKLRPAGYSDSALLFSWRNDQATREASRSQDPVLLGDHMAWLQKTLGSLETCLFIAYDTTTGTGIGTARLDVKGKVATVSVTVDPHARGVGHATGIVLALEGVRVDSACCHSQAVVREGRSTDGSSSTC